MQLLVGVPLEIVHKMWRIGPLYIMAIISGALLQYAMDPNALLVGASGGVYALILAHLANVFLVSFCTRKRERKAVTELGGDAVPLGEDSHPGHVHLFRPRRLYLPEILHRRL